MTDLHIDTTAVQQRSSAQSSVTDFVIHSRRVVPLLAGVLVLAVLVLATGSVLSLSPVEWVALTAVAPLTVVLVRQIQAACVDHFANRRPPSASTD
ncbi:hypothetical protein [Rhodococcus sp. H29-C3]|uniref:hypothetical protein n=1 Tax=Rhodococcus sp. H29-C3 TaxID=3046307 RepID=UPI0024BA46AF|nr:hypothetical protein [Rhodococcus sp. H29-C3]MDJ0362563.1 hypothetical protein [Rhodococcus sp. H29-C3]